MSRQNIEGVSIVNSSKLEKNSGKSPYLRKLHETCFILIYSVRILLAFLQMQILQCRGGDLEGGIFDMFEILLLICLEMPLRSTTMLRLAIHSAEFRTGYLPNTVPDGYRNVKLPHLFCNLCLSCCFSCVAFVRRSAVRKVLPWNVLRHLFPSSGMQTLRANVKG
jgi:hypothetical protein